MTTHTIAAVILLSAIPATAGTTVPSLTYPEPVATTPAWECWGSLYGWATALEGDVSIRGHNAPVDLGFDEILDNIDFAFMGTFGIARDRWSFLADGFYAKLGSSVSAGTSHLDVEMEQFIGNFVVGYNLASTAATRVDVYAGMRVNSLSADLDIDIIGPWGQRQRQSSHSASKTWVDPIVGVRLQQQLSEKFFFRVLGDVGGFNVSSDFTWQAMAAFGYRICEGGDLVLGYRGIGTDYTDGGFGYDVISHGLLLGFEYKF